ncbi:MAG: cell wall hydrolase [Clostridia bacterium]
MIQKNTKTYSTEIMNKFLSKAELEKEIIISNAAIEASSIICEKNNAAKKQILSGAYCTVAEAGNQGIKGQNAVFAVLNNRIADPAFKVASITQVVERPGQFDVVSRGTYTRIPPNKDTWEAICLYYKGIDYSNGAVYFYNPVISNHIPGGKKITAEINQHVFRK